MLDSFILIMSSQGLITTHVARLLDLSGFSVFIEL